MFPKLDDQQILAARPNRNETDPRLPYAFLCEQEYYSTGRIDDVATIFLTNRECPFHCLMCDLWKNTTQTTVPVGVIPAQIRHALERLPPARHVKLYNSGNFFDARAIPRADWPAIAELVREFETVIVENHPKLCGAACLEFRDLLANDGVRLEIAVGLETIHPEVLPRLNKQMTLDDFSRAMAFLTVSGISVRSFVLLKPPFLTESEGVEWALKSLDFAFNRGVGCCAVIPTRAGNGIMEQLASDGLFAPPVLGSLETVLEQGFRKRIESERSSAPPPQTLRRIFADLWDARRFATCDTCADDRIARLGRMNLTQRVEPPIECPDCSRPVSMEPAE